MQRLRNTENDDMRKGKYEYPAYGSTKRRQGEQRACRKLMKVSVSDCKEDNLRDNGDVDDDSDGICGRIDFLQKR